jgi:hypothetical protein
MNLLAFIAKTLCMNELGLTALAFAPTAQTCDGNNLCPVSVCSCVYPKKHLKKVNITTSNFREITGAVAMKSAGEGIE